MPDDENQSEQQDPKQASTESSSISASAEPPEIVPPKTKAPVHFNQQNNFYQQIPSSAWDRLSNEQVVDLSGQILRIADAQDERHYQFSKEKLSRLEQQNKRNLFVGSLVVLAGFGITGFLAMHGHELVAITISGPLATILAMLVGNRVLK